MTTLTQEEYQQKIADLKTPQEIATFVKEYTIAEGESTLVKRGRPRKFIELPTPSSNESWKEFAGNDLEEKVIALYAKGLTTR